MGRALELNRDSEWWKKKKAQSVNLPSKLKWMKARIKAIRENGGSKVY
jgi:hypothetical protein